MTTITPDIDADANRIPFDGPKIPDLFEQIDMQIIYDCLSGKKRSCIHGRHIATDRIKCALRKTFSNNTGAITEKLKLIEQAKLDAKSEEFSSEEEFDIRSEIVDRMKEKLSINSLGGFHKGARVKIRANSQYAHQNKGIGILQENYSSSNSEKYAEVKFENGYSNSYRRKDLFLVGNTIKVEKDFAIVKNVEEKNREEFIKRIVNEFTKEIIKDKKQLLDLFTNIDNFEVGDDIIMNEKADYHYSRTKRGSKGKIISIEDGEIRVRFSYLSGGGGAGSEYEIDPKTMVHETPKKVVERTDQDIYDRLYSIVKEVEKEILDSKNSSDGDNYSEKFQSIGMEALIKEQMFIPIDDDNYALNFSDVNKFVAPHLNKIYSDPDLYSSGVMVGPPAERLPNVLKLELTDGCDHNKCTYCDRYNGIKHQEKTAEQFIEHTDKVVDALEGYKKDITRVFIGSGNGLDVDQKNLKMCVEHVNRKLRLERISIYANTKAMLNKTIDELKDLRKSGLTCIYRGAESGSNEVLKYVDKGNTFDEMIDAGKKVNKSGIDLSVMLMPGLGGEKYSKGHVKGIIKLLNSIEFKYITLMTINPAEKSKYKRIMDREMEAGVNRPLNDVEIVQQIRNILSEVKPKGQKIGMFGKEIDIVGLNPINFRVIFDSDGKREVLKICDEYIRKKKKEKRKSFLNIL